MIEVSDKNTIILCHKVYSFCQPLLMSFLLLMLTACSTYLTQPDLTGKQVHEQQDYQKKEQKKEHAAVPSVVLNNQAKPEKTGRKHIAPIQSAQLYIEQARGKTILTSKDRLSMTIMTDKSEIVPPDLRFKVVFSPQLFVLLQRAGKNIWKGRIEPLPAGLYMKHQEAKIYALYSSNGQTRTDYLGSQGQVSIDTRTPQIDSFHARLLDHNQVEFSWKIKNLQGGEIIQLFYQEGKNKPKAIQTVNNSKVTSIQTELKTQGQWYITITDPAKNSARSKPLRINGFNHCFDVYDHKGKKLIIELCLDLRGLSTNGSVQVSNNQALIFTHQYPGGQLQAIRLTANSARFDYHYQVNKQTIIEHWQISQDSHRPLLWSGSIERRLLNQRYLYPIKLKVKKQEPVK